MPSLSAEKEAILAFVAGALGAEGVPGAQVAVSFPPHEHELTPDLLTMVESVELHLGIPCDRTKLTKTKPVKIDLYLPRRDLYIELDREGHDFGEARNVTLLYYPPGLPRGFRPDRWRSLAATYGNPAGATGKMNAGRALNDFVKDMFVEGQLGKILVRLPKPDLVWLLARGPEEPKLQRLREYLSDLAADLGVPELQP